MNKVENMSENINKLTIAVEKLALTQENLIKKVDNTEKEVSAIKEQPAKDWHEIKQKVIIAILSGLGSSIVAVIITLLAKGGF